MSAQISMPLAGPGVSEAAPVPHIAQNTVPMGFNPMRWDCSVDGCFNVKCRPKIEMFADCFPRAINFGDVDGIVEISGRLLVLEWKRRPIKIPTGQFRMYQTVTLGQRITVVCVSGDPETMSVTHVAKFINGAFNGWMPSDMAALKDWIRKFADWAQRNPGRW